MVIMPGVDVEGMIEDCRSEVDAGGFTVVALVGDGTGCDWAYTVGLDQNFGHPELLIVGLDAPLAGAVLELVGTRVAAGEQVRAGSTVQMDGGLELRVAEVDPLFCSQGDWFVLGREILSRDGRRWPRSLQLVWSDPAHGYPERPGDPRWLVRQPVLFSA